MLLEGLWVVSSFLAIFAVGRRVLTGWRVALSTKAPRGWYGFLDALPQIRLPFDLTLPEAVRAAVATGAGAGCCRVSRAPCCCP